MKCAPTGLAAISHPNQPSRAGLEYNLVRSLPNFLLMQKPRPQPLCKLKLCGVQVDVKVMEAVIRFRREI